MIVPVVRTVHMVAHALIINVMVYLQLKCPPQPRAQFVRKCFVHKSIHELKLLIAVISIWLRYARPIA